MAPSAVSAVSENLVYIGAFSFFPGRWLCYCQERMAAYLGHMWHHPFDNEMARDECHRYDNYKLWLYICFMYTRKYIKSFKLQNVP